MPAPPPLDGAASSTLIEDRYLRGTRLRLRRMTPAGGGPVQWKLGQKVRPDAADPGLVLHTTLYLDPGEHELLARLPGADLRKVRHVLLIGGRRFELAGPDDAVAPPPFGGAEVTDDERYSGGWLAFAPDEALAGVIARRV
ncbi:MAG: hypothetical protein E6J41_27335 [Chloroflexi bacterium]|nr:MAG: hypothetical protein E6J41_27335 [Chloroflexota bacterium]